MIQRPTLSPPAMSVQVPSLAEALGDDAERKRKLQTIRTKYGKPDPEMKKAPNPTQWVGDNRG